MIRTPAKNPPCMVGTSPDQREGLTPTNPRGKSSAQEFYIRRMSRGFHRAFPFPSSPPPSIYSKIGGICICTKFSNHSSGGKQVRVHENGAKEKSSAPDQNKEKIWIELFRYEQDGVWGGRGKYSNMLRQHSQIKANKTNQPLKERNIACKRMIKPPLLKKT